MANYSDSQVDDGSRTIIKKRRLWIALLQYKRDIYYEKKKRDLRVQAMLQSALYKAEFLRQVKKRLRRNRQEQLKKELNSQPENSSNNDQSHQKMDPQAEESVAEVLKSLDDFMVKVKSCSSTNEQTE